jgi:hypothetical protein
MLNKYLYRFNSIFFVMILMALGILFFILPKKKNSEIEKRDLATLPSFSIEKLKSGKYLDSIDLYYSDNFPFRDFFVNTAFKIDRIKGIESEKIAFYNQGLDINAGIESLKKQNNSLTTNNTSNSSLFKNDGKASDVENLSQGLLIYEGMAIEIFGGNRSTAIYMSKAVNEIRKNIDYKIKIYVGVTPTHGAFYLPLEYIDKRSSEKKNIDTIYKYLDPSITKIDIVKELSKHKNEYIFFNTDHHWTVRGAYYAYAAFCKSAGLKAVELNKLEKKVIKGFLGTYHRKTRDRRLAKNIDSVEYFIPSVRTQTFQLTGNGYGNIIKSNMFYEAAKGVNAYSVFLGGDIPATCIVSKLKNNKRILVFKNSFGNSFSPFLSAHYERTYVADYRFFNCNLKDFVEKNKITEILILHNSSSANIPSHIDNLRDILKNETVCVEHGLPEWENLFPNNILLSEIYKRHINKLNFSKNTYSTQNNNPSQKSVNNNVANQNNLNINTDSLNSK